MPRGYHPRYREQLTAMRRRRGVIVTTPPTPRAVECPKCHRENARHMIGTYPTDMRCDDCGYQGREGEFSP